MKFNVTLITRYFIVLFLCLVFFNIYSNCSANIKGKKDNNDKAGEKIFVISDHLVFFGKENYAVFSGNVKANQGETIIRCEKLTIYYKANNESAEKKISTGEDSLKKLIAEGNVRINFENKLALTKKAIYNPKTNDIDLIGSNSKLISGKNVISGNKITMNRVTEIITVVGSKTKRVKAEVYSNKK